MAAELLRLTHTIAIQLRHLQFSLQAASPETFGYNRRTTKTLSGFRVL
jgi:hypothetical protein